MEKLYILWANPSYETFEKMVAMYAVNSLRFGWWDEVELVVWGETTRLAAQEGRYRELLERMMGAGVKVSACKACADQLGVTDALESMGVEVVYWGERLTRLLKSGEKVLVV